MRFLSPGNYVSSEPESSSLRIVLLFPFPQYLVILVKTVVPFWARLRERQYKFIVVYQGPLSRESGLPFIQMVLGL